MAQAKSERLVNLTIALLSTRRLLTRDQIRASVEGYRGLTDAAFMRMFERDKDELRAMGIPIQVGSADAFFDDEPGYRIVRTDFELPSVSFTAEESNVLGAAMRVWRQANAADQTAKAMAKLRAAGVATDASRLSALAPTLTAAEPAFEPLWSATLHRSAVAFQYRAGEPERTVEPWRLAWRKGAWYLLGLDRGPGEPRAFKLSRMASIPRPVGEPNAFGPPSVDLDELMAKLGPAEPDAHAILAIRTGRAPALRRQGVAIDDAAPSGFELWEVPYASGGDMVGTIASFGADVIVQSPAELRQAVREHLRSVIVAHTGGGQ